MPKSIMVITIQCPSCAKSFPVDSNKIPERGVSVRCSACAHVFRVERPEEPTPPPPPVVEPTPPEPAVAEAPEPEPEPESDPEPELESAPSFEAPTSEVQESRFDTGQRDRDAEDDVSTESADQGSTEDLSSAPVDEWVFETDPEIDPGSLDIEAVETVPPEAESTRDESSFSRGPVDVGTSEIPSDSRLVPDGVSTPDTGPDAALEPEPVSEPPAAPEIGAFAFGKRDPNDKARRLARVLVSDMIMYNPDRHDRALANGTLKRDFEEEIRKSWKEYVEQVGHEVANSNNFWTEALNDVLAKGQVIF